MYFIANDRGDKVEGFTEVAQVMTDYYHKLLGDQRTSRIAVDQEMMQQGLEMTIEQQLKINKPFTDQEIKEAMFSIPNTKSLGLMASAVDSSRSAGIALAPE